MFRSMPRKTSVLLSGAASLSIAVTLLVALPAAVYSGNQEEFTSPFLVFLREYGPVAGAVVFLGVATACLLPGRASAAWSAALSAIAVYAWLYGNFVVYELGTLDGQTWSLKMPAWIIWVEIAGISALLIAAFLAARARPGLVAVGLALLAVGGLGSAWPAFVEESHTSPHEAEGAGAQAIFAFSKSKNVLVVLLDAMQSDIFEEVVNDNPSIRSALDGFTFYPDTAGVAPTTILSIPAIHSGMEYDPRQSTDEYYDAAVHKGSFLNDLASNGYRSALLNPIRGICPSAAMCTSATAMLGGDQASQREEAAHLLDIALLRLSPLILKPLVYNEGKWRIALLIRDERLAHPATKSNAVLAELAGKLSPVSDRPVATFLHLFSTHLPVVVNERCQFVGETIPKTRESYKAQVKCGLEGLQHVLESLHRTGIYDRTAIALLSDHGTSGLRNARAIPSPAGMNSPTMLGIANPTFAFKPFDANEPFHSVTTAISIADVPGIICGSVGDCRRTPRMPGRERGFNYYAWKGEYASLPRIPGLIPYAIVGGPMWDGSTWKRLDAE